MSGVLFLSAPACKPGSGPNSSDTAKPGSARPIDSTPPPATSFGSSTGCAEKGKGTEYEVGPGKKYAAIGDVPMETFKAGDTLRIHYRPEPYKEKLMIGGVGTKDAPIRVCGMKGPNGELPIIDGDGATTRKTLEFPYDGHQVRGLVTVGWRHSDPYKMTPEHVVIEGLEVRNGSPPYKFTDKAGKEAEYVAFAAGIFVQRGKHITLRGNVVHDNGNGVFVGTSGGEELTEDVLVEGNYIYNNGSDKNYYHHNVYNEVSGVVYQFNHFGPPKANPTQGILGANIKDRSAGVVIRFNWIEDGAHLIDLVDSQEARDPNVASPTFHETWVYGNVLIRGPVASGSMVHYGGDSGMFETYRKGTLHFFQNTVVVESGSHKDYEGTAIFELSTKDEHLDSRNNVYFCDPTSESRQVMLLGARDGVVAGAATFAGDWIREGIIAMAGGVGSSIKVEATEEGFGGLGKGKDAGFVDIDKRNFHPTASSPFKGGGSLLPEAVTKAYPLSFQYLAHGKSEARPSESAPTPGAFAAP